MEKLTDILAQKSEIEMELIENGGELTPEIEERLDLTEANLHSKIDGYHAVMAGLEYGNAEIDAEIKRLQALKKTKTNAVKRLKEYLLFLMQQFNIKSIDGAMCKVFRKATPEAVTIDDEDAMIERYKREIEGADISLPDWVKVSVSIDKTALKAAMKNNDTIPAGVSLEKGETIQFK